MSTEGFPVAGHPASVAARASELVRCAWRHAPADLDPRSAGFCVHRRGVLLYANEGALRLFGVSLPSEIVGIPLLDLISWPTRRAASSIVQSGRAGDPADLAPVLVSTLSELALLTAQRASIADDELGLVFFAEGVPAPQGAPGGEQDEMQDRNGAGRTTKVLICDDEGRLAMLTAGLLEEYGFSPHTVELGQDALTVIDSGGADVLLLDVNLTRGLSAAELLAELRGRAAGPRVVLTSGLAEEDVPKELIEDSLVAAYLPKPYTVEQLIEAMRKAAPTLS